MIYREEKCHIISVHQREFYFYACYEAENDIESDGEEEIRKALTHSYETKRGVSSIFSFVIPLLFVFLSSTFR
jgi:hypothetical protein